MQKYDTERIFSLDLIKGRFFKKGLSLLSRLSEGWDRKSSFSGWLQLSSAINTQKRLEIDQDRESERESVCVCVRVDGWVHVGWWLCVGVCESVCECVCAWVRGLLNVWAWERKSDGKINGERKRQREKKNENFNPSQNVWPSPIYLDQCDRSEVKTPFFNSSIWQS